MINILQDFIFYFRESRIHFASSVELFQLYFPFDKIRVKK
jgi:hypothetical protein